MVCILYWFGCMYLAGVLCWTGGPKVSDDWRCTKEENAGERSLPYVRMVLFQRNTMSCWSSLADCISKLNIVKHRNGTWNLLLQCICLLCPSVWWECNMAAKATFQQSQSYWAQLEGSNLWVSLSRIFVYTTNDKLVVTLGHWLNACAVL